MLRLLAFFMAFAWAHAAWSADAAPAADDPVLEQRVMALSSELRCLVCQNQTIADSNAGLAIDLRNQVREQMKKGLTDGQIVDYMVERYGDFVRYRPPFKMTTVMLWLGPFLLLAAGVGVLYFRLARRRREEEPQLSEAEHRRAQLLLADDETGRK